ncbi:GNAT family N-acetyltransferase [Actinoplanes sp. KI2]|uniref:GNAT family N-acetyltransferase n=1 Tax=Actinoplanes sp. KI2 TaxID=2983315 RepID=UPI0021D577FA|nr:GNAT family N-acetyltransferase [Actinoplanes sp. KI2]MCU7728376.1 GNAT family N-acetyltransferase [Actinoplanes sp. KI2]
MITRLLPADVELFERAVYTFRGVTGDGAYLGSPGAIAFVASRGQDISGWCWGYHLIRPDDSSMLYLHQLEVAEAYRRQGIGRALLDAFIRAGARSGATKMFLTTGETNAAARALYDSMGGGLAEQGPTVSYWFLLNP